MPKGRIVYFLLFCLCTCLALATRHYKAWFPNLIVVYGGDVIWAGMFVFFLRILFVRTALWKLALINYILGVLDECSQLITAPWFVAIRQTKLGKLMLGVGFVWSDLVCYAIGTLIAWGMAIFIDKWTISKKRC
jgi:hypothetical protein